MSETQRMNNSNSTHGMKTLVKNRSLWYGIVSLAVLMAAPHLANAVVDDAHSFALEAAQEDVEKGGVKIRYDYASGSLKNGQTTTVGYQVFRGNAYWFYLGSSEMATKFTCSVTDAEGKEIKGEVRKHDNSYVFHFVPERTMLVAVTLSGVAKDAEEFSWALVYGYKTVDRSEAKAFKAKEKEGNENQ